MATEEEAEEYRRRITEILEGHGFSWVVTQAESEIGSGKSVTKEVTETELLIPTEETGFAARRLRKRRARLLSSEAYSEEEKLEILLRGFEAALVERAELEAALLDDLDVEKIEFIPERPLPDAERVGETPHRLDRSTRNASDSVRSRAMAAIRRLRGSLSERP